MTAFFVCCLIAFIVWCVCKSESEPQVKQEFPDELYADKLEQATQKWAECRVELYRAQSEAQTYKQHFEHSQQKYDKLLGQKKSSEVKTGQIVEQLVGFLDEFPYPDDEIKAMYQPVDLIVFRPDEIVFVEVKSGDSALSEKQRKIRDLINEKKVRFETHRVNEKGYKVK